MHYPLITGNEAFDAVILGNGDFPVHCIPLRLLSNAEYICCCDGAGMELIEHGVMPDAIVGDGDSLSEDFRLRHADLIYIVSEQEHNDLTKATRFCIDKGFRNIALLGCTGKREDHTMGNISLLAYHQAHYDVRNVMVTDYAVIFAAEGLNTFSTFARQQVSIFNLSCKRLCGEGLRWHTYAYEEMWQGTVNEAVGDKITLDGDGAYIVYLTHEPKL